MRRVLPILSFILLTAFSAKSQDSRIPHLDPQEKVKVYPNPAQTYITIDLQNSYQKGLTIAVYSFLGKKMYENQIVTEKTTLTVTDYNRGIYVYHVTDAVGKILFTGKFQVSR
ncbi:MAG: T9SS type A sorting domain-containing protein [Chitinophagales bacterium]